jgi:hypothetical protein
MSSGWQVWGGRIRRALSIRVVFLCLVGGGGCGVLVGTKWPGAEMPVVWTSAALLYLVAVFNDGQMVACDACRKRVKIGATTCSHCGYSRA